MSSPCVKCTNPVALTSRFCAVCSTDNGFPNVRKANAPDEEKALDFRLTQARASVAARGVTLVFDRFVNAVDNSHAVMNRTFGALFSWVNGDNPQFLPFHRQVELGREPATNEWDQGRESAESQVNPYCYRDLNFAALSLDATGMTYYGDYAVQLKDVVLEDRASIFDSNPFFFIRNHNLLGGKMPPLGYRAPWSRRGELAAVKLHNDLQTVTTTPDFVEILMEDRRNESDCDFVEVHIFGPVNRQGIDRVTGPVPKQRADRLLWSQAKRKLAEAGAKVVEI